MTPAPSPFLVPNAELVPPHVERGMRIGLLGGSFNPPHAAHLLITETAFKRLALAEVWWIVTPGNPLKEHGELAPLAERIALSKAITNSPHIKVTAFEAALGTAYTAQTLRFVTSRAPSTHFVWLMGADNLASFHHWNHWASIFHMLPIAVADRPRWRYRALASPAAQRFAAARLPEALASRLPFCTAPAWAYLSGPLSDLSSTALRNGRKRAAVLS